jgi:hypothetical protein
VRAFFDIVGEGLASERDLFAGKTETRPTKRAHAK